MTAAHYAAVAGSVDCFEELLSHGADINAQDEFGQTPLMFAAQHSHYIAVQLMLKHGAKVNVTTKNGTTALMKAASTTHMHSQYCAEQLIDAKAKVNAVTVDGMTALAFATVANNIGMIELLAGANADTNAKLKDGRPIIMLASTNALISLLISYGADHLATDADDKGVTDRCTDLAECNALKVAIDSGIALRAYRQRRAVEREHRRQQSVEDRLKKRKAEEAMRKQILERFEEANTPAANTTAVIDDNSQVISKAAEEHKEPAPVADTNDDDDDGEGEPVAEAEDDEAERAAFRARTYEEWRRQSQSEVAAE